MSGNRIEKFIICLVFAVLFVFLLEVSGALGEEWIVIPESLVDPITVEHQVMMNGEDPFVDSTDGDTAETALTIAQADVRLSKNGQNMAQKNDVTACAHDELGYYNCELDATDTNTEGSLVLCVHESGALPVRHEFSVLSEAAWDSMFAAKDTGYMDVNVKAVSEDTIAADNLESACDNYSATRGLAGTALPAAAAAAGAAGGIPTDSTGKTSFNDVSAADVNAQCDTALSDYDPPTKAEMDSGFAAVPTASEIQTEMEENGASILDTLQDRLTAVRAGYLDNLNGHNAQSGDNYSLLTNGTYGLSAIEGLVDDIETRLGTPSNFGSGTATIAANLEDLADNGTQTYDRSTDSLQAIRDRGDADWSGGGSAPTAAEVADAVWDEAKAGHVGAGSFGEEVQSHATTSDVNTAAANVSVDEIQATAVADLFNTDSGTDYASAVAGSVVKETADNAGGSALTEAGIADAVWDEAKSGHVAAGSFGEEVQAHALSSEVSALNDLSAAQVNAEVDTALADYDPPTKAELDSGLAGLNDPAVGAIADAVWDEAKAGHTGVGSFGEEVQAHALSSEISALNDVSAAEVNAQCDTALSDYGANTTTPPTVAAIADAVWDEVKAGHVGVGSFGEEVQAHALSSEVSTVEGKVDTVDTEVGAIQADLDNATDGLGALKALIDAIQADLDNGTDGLGALKTLIDNLNDISVADVTGAEVDNDGTAISLAGAMKLALSVLTGKSSGGGGATIVFRDIADTKTRVSATVDANGNRTGIGTRDAT